VTTLKIWKDTIRADFCKGPTCRRRIWWAQISNTGRQMCFDKQPEALETVVVLGTNRELLTVDASTNHWATCPDRATFKRPRRR